MAEGIGLSVGATALRAVAIGRSAVTRSPVLTLYPHRPAEVGVPSQNSNLVERGLIITDFVDRVGDPVAIIAADGSSHPAGSLLADALLSLLYAVTGGRPAAEPIGVTHPAHWRPAAIEALRSALAEHAEFRDAVLTSDAQTALTALADDPGVPTRGIIAVCDIGGSGASVTLADAANGFRPIGPTVRHTDLSGDLIDQALLARVVGDLGTAGSVDLSSTSAIGSLSRLRGQCRAAKERLSTSAVTSLPVELSGQRTEVRVTRTELDDAIGASVAGFVDVVQDTLARSAIRSADLVAVASVGGGARIAIVTTSLSEHLRVPVITAPQPELTAAIGAGLKAVRGLVPDGATAMAPAAAAVAPVSPPADSAAPASSTFRALAWSDAEHVPELEPHEPDDAQQGPDYEPYDPRPRLAFADENGDEPAAAVVPWYRRPVGILAIAVIVALAAIGTAAVYVLRSHESSTPATSSTSPVTTGAPPTSAAPAPSSEAPPAQAPDNPTVVEQAPPPAVTVTQEAPPPPPTEAPPPPPTTTEAPPVTTTEPPSTVTVTETTAPSSSVSSSTQAPGFPGLPYQTIPGLPFVPAPIQPAQP